MVSLSNIYTNDIVLDVVLKRSHKERSVIPPIFDTRAQQGYSE
jgi:hypothetical protein